MVEWCRYLELRPVRNLDAFNRLHRLRGHHGYTHGPAALERSTPPFVGNLEVAAGARAATDRALEKTRILRDFDARKEWQGVSISTGPFSSWLWPVSWLWRRSHGLSLPAPLPSPVIRDQDLIFMLKPWNFLHYRLAEIETSAVNSIYNPEQLFIQHYLCPGLAEVKRLVVDIGQLWDTRLAGLRRFWTACIETWDLHRQEQGPDCPHPTIDQVIGLLREPPGLPAGNQHPSLFFLDELQILLLNLIRAEEVYIYLSDLKAGNEHELDRYRNSTTQSNIFTKKGSAEPYKGKARCDKCRYHHHGKRPRTFGGIKGKQFIEVRMCENMWAQQWQLRKEAKPFREEYLHFIKSWRGLKLGGHLWELDPKLRNTTIYFLALVDEPAKPPSPADSAVERYLDSALPFSEISFWERGELRALFGGEIQTPRPQLFVAPTPEEGEVTILETALEDMGNAMTEVFLLGCEYLARCIRTSGSSIGSLLPTFCIFAMLIFVTAYSLHDFLAPLALILQKHVLREFA